MRAQKLTLLQLCVITNIFNSKTPCTKSKLIKNFVKLVTKNCNWRNLWRPVSPLYIGIHIVKLGRRGIFWSQVNFCTLNLGTPCTIWKSNEHKQFDGGRLIFLFALIWSLHLKMRTKLYSKITKMDSYNNLVTSAFRLDRRLSVPC